MRDGPLALAGASARSPTLFNAASYAIPGGIFFRISALRLRRAARAGDT